MSGLAKVSSAGLPCQEPPVSSDLMKSGLRKSQPRWIWCRGDSRDNHVWVWARKQFDYTPQERNSRAWLEITADLRYDLWVNGNLIGFGPPRHHAPTPTVDSYELASHLVSGNNTIAIRVYSLGNAAISSCMPQRGGLWVRVCLGENEIVSDQSWKMRRDPAYRAETAPRGSVQPPNECYDARLSLGAIQSPGYDDGEWAFAKELEALPSLVAMESRDIPFMTSKLCEPDRIIEAGRLRVSSPYPEISLTDLASALERAEYFPPKERDIIGQNERSISCPGTVPGSNECSYVIWDLGRLWTGYPSVELSGPSGMIVDLCYGEHLTNGRVDPAKTRMNYFDRVVLGDSPLSHRITWPKCARYVQVVVHGGEAHARLLWLRSSFPVARKGAFSSSSPVLDHAVELSLHTLELCMEDSYLDTPWRERGAWLGDDLVKAKTSYAYFGDYSLARRFLLHHARGQLSTGQMQGKYPGNVTSYVSTWTLAYPPSVLEYCVESGDWDLARRVWKNLVALVGWITSKINADGVLQAPDVHVDERTNRYNFIDWAPVDMRGANAAWNAFGYNSLNCAARIAMRIRKAAQAEQWMQTAELLRKRFQICFWDEERGVFVNGVVDGKKTSRWGCHENTLAILYGLATESQRKRIFERLKQEDLQNVFVPDDNDYDIEIPACGKMPSVSLALSRYRWPDQKMVPLGTPYFAMYWLEALCQAGFVRDAQRFIETRWGELARQGATSVWETWDMRQSLSHAWSCSPAVIAARYFAGVQRKDDSGIRYSILPAPGLLKRIQSRVSTRFGVIQVSWDQERLVIDVPVGLEVEAGLPVQRDHSLRVNGEIPPALGRVRCAGTVYQVALVPPGRSVLTLAGNENRESEQLLNERLSLAGS